MVRPGVLRFACYISGLVGASTPLSAQTIYTNSTFTTGIGNGANGTNTSVIGVNPTTGAAGTSFGSTSNGNFRLADDFTVPVNESWNVTGITHFSYVTGTYGNPPDTPFTSISMNIRDLPPDNPASVILFSSTTIGNNTFSNTHRVTTTTLTGATRPIFGVEASFTAVTLPAGSYWMDVQLNGGFSPGGTVFDPVDNRAELVPGNTLQFNATTSSWTPAQDTGAGVVITLPFTLQGSITPVPEPTTLFAVAALSMYGVTRLRRRRA